MPRILMVEDDAIMVRMVARKLQDMGDYEVRHAPTVKEALEQISDQESSGEEPFFLALVDYTLPDARNGEAVGMVQAHLPVVVVSMQYDEDIRDFAEEARAIDYVVKQGERNIRYIAELVSRLDQNRGVKTLVVDDSATSRLMVAGMLKSYLFQVLQAEDGDQALAVLKEQPDIRLVITDYIMPNKDGLELLWAIREDLGRDRTDLAVIGISGQVGDSFSARFIKQGGNDFLVKPFLKEELICRVLQNIEFVEHLSMIRRLAQCDHLTGLYNRRHFFEIGQKYYLNAQRENMSLSLAMIDIDHFKSINDRYGHYAGDMVLKHMAEMLERSFRGSDLVARLGGEEFGVLAVNVDPEHVEKTMERFKTSMEQSTVRLGSAAIKVTVSIGVTSELGESLDDMLNRADQQMYNAKAAGRNRVMVA